MTICKSGGAIGADTVFGMAALKAGHRVVHYTFSGHDTIVPKSLIRILSPYELSVGEETVIRASKFLKRNWKDYKGSRRNLILRNFWQVWNSESVYAVSEINDRGMVSGGTGWAVTMAIILRIPDIYVFDQECGEWFKWYGKDNPTEDRWFFCIPPTRPVGIYAGIGTRDLTESGKSAILSLYSEE
jgi:hypothetical protein